MSSALPATRPAIQIGSLNIDFSRPFFILGPCVIESESFLRETARRIHETASAAGVDWILKASYDKANRTSGTSFRGPGCEEGCRLLSEIGQELGVPVTTDVHTAEEAAVAGKYIDLLQIPAFLCRQTDLLLAAAATGRAISVKKGQFLAPWDVKPIAGKLEKAGCRNFFFIERGTTFGYNNLVVDMRSLAWIREAGYPIVFDATHSVQQPGGLGESTGGDRSMAPVLARAAVAAGCDGVFMETHPDPDHAFSDGPNQIHLENLPAILSQLTLIDQTVRS